LPPPAVYDKISSIDSGDNHYTISDLAVSEDSVRENFLKYRVLDERVKFRKGWFHETMPEVAKEINKIAILRLDGDLYVSTLPVLQAMYDKVSIGGYIMLDDVGLRGFDTALEEFRLSNNITTPITHVANSHNVCYWIKE
jgi:O-methyltransferase